MLYNLQQSTNCRQGSVPLVWRNYGISSFPSPFPIANKWIKTQPKYAISSVDWVRCLPDFIYTFQSLFFFIWNYGLMQDQTGSKIITFLQFYFRNIPPWNTNWDICLWNSIYVRNWWCNHNGICHDKYLSSSLSWATININIRSNYLFMCINCFIGSNKGSN